MLKKTVKYLDYDGNSRTEDLYFHLSKTELIAMSMDLPDGLIEEIGDDPSKIDEKEAAAKIVSALGNKGVFEFIKSIVLNSYGIKSSDGRKFEKSEEITKDFTQTLAFDQVLMELMSNEQVAADFINKVMAVNK